MARNWLRGALTDWLPQTEMLEAVFGAVYKVFFRLVSSIRSQNSLSVGQLLLGGRGKLQEASGFSTQCALPSNSLSSYLISQLRLISEYKATQLYSGLISP